jgi:hypothetical protein
MRCGSEGGSPVRASASSATGPGSAEATSAAGACSLAVRSGVKASWTRSHVVASAAPDPTNSPLRCRRRTVLA